MQEVESRAGIPQEGAFQLYLDKVPIIIARVGMSIPDRPVRLRVNSGQQVRTGQ